MPNTPEGWKKYAEQHLLGRTISQVDLLTQKEVDCLGWPSGTLVLELDDGTLLFPAADDEMNGPGALAGQSGTTREKLLFPVISPADKHEATPATLR